MVTTISYQGRPLISSRQGWLLLEAVADREGGLIWIAKLDFAGHAPRILLNRTGNW
jgi:hypothetical protein